MDSFIASIIPCAFSTVPRGWAVCNGQVVPINQNQALYAVIGPFYGDFNPQTFVLPDLRTRAAMHTSQDSFLGDERGTAQVMLFNQQMPQHSHTIVTGASSDTTSPASAYPGNDGAYSNAAPDTSMALQTLGPAGGGIPISVMQPYLGVNYMICMYGYWPQRP